MRIASALSTTPEPQALAEDLARQLQAGLRDGTSSGEPIRSIDLLLVFATSPLRGVFSEIVRHLRQALRPRALLGCTAESVLGVGDGGGGTPREVEREPAAAALALSLPGVVVDTFHLADEEWPELLGERDTLRNRLEAGENLRAFVMLADPYSTPVVQLLDTCSAVFPAAPIIGGMASGLHAPGDARLAVDEHIYTSGLVGASLAGNVQIDCVVSQGCRPIGEPLEVTGSQKNLITGLGGRPPLEVLEEMIAELPPRDRELLRTQGLQVGRVIDEGKGFYGRGDFLIRPVIGLSRESGAIAIGDLMRPGQHLQFHIRDAQSADEDLRLLLQGETLLASEPAGALLFSCNGRGTNLFDVPDHDVRATREVLGGIPVAGFFCAGELGPVGRRNFIHGQTAALALFRPAEG